MPKFTDTTYITLSALNINLNGKNKKKIKIKKKASKRINRYDSVVFSYSSYLTRSFSLPNETNSLYL
jgi:hypothetical protein